MFQDKTKHSEIDVHFIWEMISKGILKRVKIYSLDQNADILTKSLGYKQHGFLSKILGLVDLFKVE